MNIDKNSYQEHLDFVKGIFTLGGLSECGKTTAGYRFQKLGIRKSKIIHIEYDMMKDRGIDPSAGVSPDVFDSLYKDNPDYTFKEFLFRLTKKMKEEGYQFASLESLYRAPLGLFLKKELSERAVNIYIDAPIEDRVYREMIKLNKKAEQNGEKKTSFNQVLENVRKKDAFKIERHALDVKDIADYVVDNSRNVTLDAFISKIDSIAQKMGAIA